MISLFLVLFAAGMLTILLPCILPLLPIVLGVSIADRSKWRPLGVITGMVVSFVGFTFLLQVALSQFVELADILRLGTYQVLFLFGVAFAIHNRSLSLALAVLSGLFFWDKGIVGMALAAVFGVVAMLAGGRVSSRIQQLGSNIQQQTVSSLGTSSFVSAFIIGLTLGLVWVPCAGPALGFAFTVVRERPGIEALLLLLAYASGTAVPLLIVGYGGQRAVRSVRAVSSYSGRIKQVAGFLLIVSALALHFGWFMQLQTWLVQNTSYGSLGTMLEERLFPQEGVNTSASNIPAMDTTALPKITRAPALTGLGPWHNSEPLTMEGLKGKVVLVDFWTYSCINCIRTLPYIQGYWDKYKDQNFVVLGVHTPEFTFEKDQENVAAAIKRHGLTYPVAQDNDFGTWNAFANRYWPAKYLIDANGYIRYTHFGEGAYEDTDRAIASLLKEAGADLGEKTMPEPSVKPKSLGKGMSPEIYLGSRSWPALGNAQGEPTPKPVTYAAPASMDLHKYYLQGEWRLIEDEFQQMESNTGEIRMKFLGSEANLVMGIDMGQAKAEVYIDGKRHRNFIIDRHDLYPIFQGEYGEHEMVIKITGSGARGYAFTFGSI